MTKRSGDGDEPCRLGQVQVRKETGAAILCASEDDDEEFWVPKSVIHDDSEAYDDRDGATGELIVKTWWARERGLV